MQGQMVMTTQYVSSASRVFGFRAPAGRLDEQERLFATMVTSVQVNPAWEAALNRLALNLAQIRIQGAAERSRIWSEATAEVGRIRMEAWENQQASQDRVAQAWSQTMRGVEILRRAGRHRHGRAPVRLRQCLEQRRRRVRSERSAELQSEHRVGQSELDPHGAATLSRHARLAAIHAGASAPVLAPASRSGGAPRRTIRGA